MSNLRIPVGSADHTQGPAGASITLVEYGDYECPYCALAFPNVRRVQKQFDKQLKFVFRHFPLTEVHPFAEPAAEAAEYAAAHDCFWSMHDGLYTQQDQLGVSLIFALGETHGLSEAGLRDAMATRRYAAKIQADFLGGARSGVNGTPSFFIDGQRFDGAFSYENIVVAINARLHAIVR